MVPMSCSRVEKMGQRFIAVYYMDMALHGSQRIASGWQSLEN